jgi:hypothetical protein
MFQVQGTDANSDLDEPFNPLQTYKFFQRQIGALAESAGQPTPKYEIYPTVNVGRRPHVHPRVG